jgi:membrane protease YdiL (CAAX protease family)
MALAVALAAALNLALNLLLPAALYVPAALLGVLAALLVAARVGGCRATDLGLAPADLGSGWRHGAAAAAAVAAVLALAVALPSTRGLFADRRVDQHSVAVLLYVALVRIPLGTVALEETLFRGVLLGLGLRRWRPAAAVAWSSLLFGVWHVLPARGLPGFNPVLAGATHGTPRHLLAIALGVAGTALGGALLCWLRLRARSLLAPVLLHLVGNGLAYAAAWEVLRHGPVPGA